MFEVRKVGAEWCAFHPGGREVARSHDKQLLQGYIDSLNAVDDAIAKTAGTSGPATYDVLKASRGENPWSDTTPQESNTMTLAKISYRTRARSTGAATASGRLAEKGKWAAMCVSHGVVSGAVDKGTEAEKLTSKPQEFCRTCANIVAGDLPKVAKDPELDELL